MKKLIVLNHKMNLEYDEVVPYIKKLNEIETTNDLIVCPSNIYLTDFINYCSWGVGAQNVFHEESGNYTGEVSTSVSVTPIVEETAENIKEAGAKSVLEQTINSL